KTGLVVATQALERAAGEAGLLIDGCDEGVEKRAVLGRLFRDGGCEIDVVVEILDCDTAHRSGATGIHSVGDVGTDWPQTQACRHDWCDCGADRQSPGDHVPEATMTSCHCRLPGRRIDLPPTRPQPGSSGRWRRAIRRPHPRPT